MIHIQRRLCGMWFTNYHCRNTSNRRVGWHWFQNNATCANFSALADLYIPQDFCTRRDQNAPTNLRMTISRFFTSTPKVTDCRIDTSSSMTAVSPTTIPVA